MSRNRDRPPREHEPAYAVRVEAGTVTDAHLVGYLDGEFSAASGASLREILAERADLTARLAQLERRSVSLSALLREVSPGDAQVQQSAALIRPHVMRSEAQPSSMQRLPAAVKAAAAIALVFGLALFVPDARAWLLERLRVVGTFLDSDTREPAPEPPAIAPPEPMPAVVAVTFTITRDTIDVGAHQLAGVLVVRRGSSATATAEATGVEARFTVLPGGVRIEGPVSPDAVYSLAVPRHVTVLRLQRAAASVTVHPLPPDTSALRIRLAPR